MFRFDFERAKVLAEIRQESVGKVRVRPGLTTESIVLTWHSIRFIRTKHLDDSGTVVVDLGPEGMETKQVVIAGGSQHSLEQFFRFNSDMNFPGMTGKRGTVRAH
jgi:hypothetical protein